MRRAALALVVLAAIAAAVVAAGCGKRKSVTAPNLPPETTVFLRGGVDATNHRVHIYWFGSDPDGDVVAYQMRFAPSGGNPDPSWGTVYCALPGRCTDSLFTVPTGDSALIHTQFEIRSVDNQGAVDPTPAIQPFQLSNLAPKVHITNPLRRARAAGQPEDTSFASVTINWEVDDPDGGGPGLRYHVWLDGRYDAYDSTTANTFTVESSRFLNAAGTYVSGYRTLYLQAVDDGGRFGPIDSTSWYVRAPATVLDPTTKRGRLLVIDDSNSLTNSNFAVDTLYANVVARSTQADPYREGLSRYVTLAPGTFSFMRLQYSNPFRSARDLMQTFRQFDAVVWYRGYEDQTISLTLRAYQDSVGQFILSGGRLFLEGLYLIEGNNSFGSLRQDFITRYLNCRRFYQTFDGGIGDSTVGIGIETQAFQRSAMYADTIMRLDRPATVPGVPPGLRGFVVNDTSQVAVWARGATLSPADPNDMPFAMTVNRSPGRVIVVSFPVRALASPPPTASLRRSLSPSYRVLSRLLFDRINGLLAP